MRKVYQKARYLLLMLSFWLVILPAYHNVVLLDSSDLAPSYPCIQTSDEVDSIACLKKPGKVLDSAFFIKQIFLEKPSPFQILNSLFQNRLSPLSSKLLPLRC
jgi:hypothetical protein